MILPLAFLLTGPLLSRPDPGRIQQKQGESSASASCKSMNRLLGALPLLVKMPKMLASSRIRSSILESPAAFQTSHDHTQHGTLTTLYHIERRQR